MTIDATVAMQTLHDAGVRLCVGVPDSTLPGIDLAAIAVGMDHVAAVNEGAAVGIAVGHAIATRTPACVYLQNAGLGIAIDAWASMGCPDALDVPMVWIVGWRGHPRAKDPGHHLVHGQMTAPTLALAGLAVVELESERDLGELVRTDAKAMALLVAPGQWRGDHGRTVASRSGLGRASAIAAIVAALPSNAHVVVGVGYMGRELASRRKAMDTRADDVLVAGGMGHASSVALGLALAEPARRLVCIDGDGAFAMHLGASGTIAGRAPSSFVHIVLDNACHESVGGPPSLLADVDASALARALGYRSVVVATTVEEIRDALASTDAGPTFVHVRTVVGDPVPPRP